MRPVGAFVPKLLAQLKDLGHPANNQLLQEELGRDPKEQRNVPGDLLGDKGAGLASDKRLCEAEQSVKAYRGPACSPLQQWCLDLDNKRS